MDKESKLTLDEYQKEARKTAIYPRFEKWSSNMPVLSLVYPALKLAGEAGEVSEKVGKLLRDKNGALDPDDKTELVKEFGDVLWYVADIACELGVNLGTIGEINIEKLKSRKGRGKLKGSGDNR